MPRYARNARFVIFHCVIIACLYRYPAVIKYACITGIPDIPPERIPILVLVRNAGFPAPCPFLMIVNGDLDKRRALSCNPRAVA
jgi:hypothetical protein